MWRRVAIAGVAMGVALAAAAASGPNMLPGVWEETMTAPDGTTQTHQLCFLRKDIDNTDKFQRGLIPAPNGNCKSSDYRASGDEISYSLTCDGRVKKVTARYAGDHASATVDDGGQISHITRTRIGDCTVSDFSK
jgi:hypothetical protein